MMGRRGTLSFLVTGLVFYGVIFLISHFLSSPPAIECPPCQIDDHARKVLQHGIDSTHSKHSFKRWLKSREIIDASFERSDGEAPETKAESSVTTKRIAENKSRFNKSRSNETMQKDAMFAAGTSMHLRLKNISSKYVTSEKISHNYATTPQSTFDTRRRTSPNGFQIGNENSAQITTPTWEKEALENPHNPHRLGTNLVPNVVHWFWCGHAWFEFQFYLSVLSAIRFIDPDKIIIYYYQIMLRDKKFYNLWYHDMMTSYPFVKLHELTSDEIEMGACHADEQVHLEYVWHHLSRVGGIFIGNSTWISNFPQGLRKFDKVLGKNFMMSKINSSSIPTGESMTYKCPDIQEYSLKESVFICITPKLPPRFYPKDIWGRDDALGRLARRIFYGSSAFPKPTPTYNELVPYIGHMVWLGGGEMDFLFYLSVLSAVYILKVETLYIHGDKPPSGMYWNRIKSKHFHKVRLVYRVLPNTVFSYYVNKYAHMSDIIRVDIMNKYGGIYMDTDTIWVRPIDRWLLGYDAVASLDWTQWDAPFPDLINFGVTLGKKGGKFWKLFRESMAFWREESWSWNGLRLPYKIYEKNPDLLYIYNHLQIICFNFDCHPTFNKDYHNVNIHHRNAPFSWKTDTHAFHWTAPVPLPLRSEEALYQSDDMFAKIGKFVLEKAGELKNISMLRDGFILTDEYV